MGSKNSLSLGESGDVWVARDEDTGVTSQGQTRQAALENLDEAVAGYHGVGGIPERRRTPGDGDRPLIVKPLVPVVECHEFVLDGVWAVL